MRILFISDAWYPQVNGVVRTIDTTRKTLEDMGHEVKVIGPDEFITVPMPSYNEIRLAMLPGAKLTQMIDDFIPDAVHIATEGPLGWAAREYCLNREIQFTTSYHTQFPEYIKKRIPLPLSWSYRMLRVFHGPSSAVMVATISLERMLRSRGFTHLHRWSRGVDVNLFRVREKDELDFPRPIMLYVGRVAVEKNIEAFLSAKNEGTKVVVGEGPSFEKLKEKYKDVKFLGTKKGEELAKIYAAADVFVFPSKTDTFGLVMLEALACGVPVAAYPVPGPLDVLGEDGAGVAVLDNDLSKAIDEALKLDTDKCRPFAEARSWEAATHQFLRNLDPFDPGKVTQKPID